MMLSLSATRLESMACPHRFKLLYICVKEEPVPELILGRTVHRVAAEYVLHLRDSRRQTDMTVLAKIQDAIWAQRDARLPESLHDDFETLCRRLLDWLPDPETIVGSEMQFGFDDDWKAAEWDDAAWRGIMDVFQIRRDDGANVAVIRDWTTAALGGSIAAKKDLQLRFYGLMAWRGYGLSRAEVTVHSLRTGATKTVELDEADHEKTAARLASERDRILSMLEDPESEWPAVPGSLCGICRLPCPAVANAMGSDVPVRLDTDEDARELLHRVVILDEQRKRLLKPLRAFAAARGSVTDNGMEAAFRPSESRSYPMERVLDVGGVQIRDALKVDRRMLFKLPNRYLVQAIEELATVKTSERFSVAKVKVPGEIEEDGGGEE